MWMLNTKFPNVSKFTVILDAMGGLDLHFVTFVQHVKNCIGKTPKKD